MSAYIVNRSHIDAMVRLAVLGPSDRGPAYPGDGWRGTNWYAASPRETVAGAVDSNDYFRRLAEIRHSADHETADRLARLLIAANVESVRYRYPDGPADDLPGPRPAYWETELPRPDMRSARPTAIEGLSILTCYEYQSCEHPGWEGSEAQRFCDALRLDLIGALPGYVDAPWEWTDGARVTA